MDRQTPVKTLPSLAVGNNVCFVANLDVGAECEESLVNTNLDLKRPKNLRIVFLAQVT